MKKIKSILKRYALYLSLIVIIGIMVGGYFLTKDMYMEIRRMEEEIRTKHAQLTAFEEDRVNAPSPELIARLTQEQQHLNRKFNFLLNNFSTTYPVVPEFAMYPSVEWKKHLYFSLDRLYRRAEIRQVSLPVSLGFQTIGLIPPEQIPSLALQFAVVQDLLNLVIDSGVTVVETITYGTPQQGAFYQMLPLELNIRGTSNEIMRFLTYIDNPSSYFLIRNFSVTKASEGLFRAVAVVNAIIIKSPET